MKFPCAWLASLILVAFVSVAHAGGNTSTWNFTVNGTTRSALVYIPDVATSAATPVVFVFHGHGGSSQAVKTLFGFDTRWPEAISIYPQGLAGVGTRQDPGGTQPGWQLSPGDQGNRDVIFFDAILARVKETYKVDSNRVYCAGFSNGAYFTYVLWHERPTVFAAYGPCSGSSRNYGTRLKPAPAIIQGEDDPASPVPGSTQEATMRDIRVANRCSENTHSDWPHADPSASPIPQIYASNPANTPVVTWLFHGNHKVLPVEANQVVTFFQRH